MLITTITVLTILLGGGGLGNHTSILELLIELTPQIQEHVQDETRAAEAEAIVEALQARMRELGEEIQSRGQGLIAADRNYDATREDFEAAFAEINATWDEAEKALVEGSMKLREHITEDEWSAIYDELKKKRN